MRMHIQTRLVSLTVDMAKRSQAIFVLRPASVGSSPRVGLTQLTKNSRNVEYSHAAKRRSIPDSNWGYQKNFDSNQNLE
jgi:hypothetical protein